MDHTDPDLALRYAGARLERAVVRNAIAERVLDAIGAILGVLFGGLVHVVVILDLMGVI